MNNHNALLFSIQKKKKNSKTPIFFVRIGFIIKPSFYKGPLFCVYCQHSIEAYVCQKVD